MCDPIKIEKIGEEGGEKDEDVVCHGGLECGAGGGAAPPPARAGSRWTKSASASAGVPA